MRISLIGKGKMGRLVESLARDGKHEIMTTVDGSDAGSSIADLAKRIKGSDVVIDFSTEMAVRRNVGACMLASVPMVEGTTGWNPQQNEIRKLVNEADGAFVYGANFSVGVNLFYRVVDFASEMFAKFQEYEVFIEEQHHSRKTDAPSGTALKLKEIVTRHFPRQPSISATRAGSIPGTHRVGFDGIVDQILLEHSARSREGFAVGALLAAEWIVGKKGFYEFSDILDEILNRGKS